MRKLGQWEIIDVPKLVRNNKKKWANVNLTEVNESTVRLGIFEGEVQWHRHNLDDELFFVLDGRLLLDLEGKTLELKPHQGYTVPRMTLHRTRADEKAVVLMVEGNTVNPRACPKVT